MDRNDNDDDDDDNDGNEDAEISDAERMALQQGPVVEFGRGLHGIRFVGPFSGFGESTVGNLPSGESCSGTVSHLNPKSANSCGTCTPPVP